MRHTILFFLSALILLQLDLSAAEEQSDAIVSSDKRLEFRRVPMSAELKQKFANKTLAAGGGNEFYCLLPPNDRTIRQGNLSIYICSGEDCSTNKPIRVTVERAGQTTKLAEFQMTMPGQSVALTIAEGTGIQGAMRVLDKQWELLTRRSDYSSRNVVNDKGFKITSEGGDIFVYVGSFSQQTADGYMVLPVHLLGNRYIHCSRPDNDEQGRKSEIVGGSTTEIGDFRTGFSCIATAPNTVITANLVANQQYCIYYDGARANGATVTSPTLKPNEIWSVVNGLNSTKNQICDFTGTVVHSLNDFAMISWVQRTGIPVFSTSAYLNGYGRDNLVEQLLPTEYWGKDFISVQFKGTYESESIWKNVNDVWAKNPGQYFRVVASEPNTTFTVEYHDLQTLGTKGSWGGTLGAGQWAEKGEGIIPPNENTPQSGIAGAAHWSSNKPIQVMQYTQSQNVFYRSSEMDPCMVLVPPTEQYGHNTTFKTAPNITNAALTEHHVSLYIKGPVNADGSPNTDYTALQECFESIQIFEDGGQANKYSLTSKDPTVYSNLIPGTPYYFARWDLPQDKTVYVSAHTPIAGTVYGFGSAISYAWPTAMGLVQVGTNDPNPPIVEHSFECSLQTLPGQGNRIDTGYVTIRSQWWDTVFIEGSEFEDAIEDVGVGRRPDMTETTDNLLIDDRSPRYTYLDPSLPPSYEWNGSHNFKQGYVEYRTKNPYEDVIATIRYQDGAGNEVADEIVYVADKLRFYDLENDPELTTPITSLNFGSVVVGMPVSKTVVVKNINTDELPVFVTDLREVVLRDGDFEISTPSKSTLDIGDTVHLTVTYRPTTTNNVDDYLFVSTRCLLFRLSLVAGAGFPMIRVSEAAFGPRAVGGTYTMPIHIENPGTLDLTITNATFTPAQQVNFDTFALVTTPNGTFKTALPTVANPWIVPAGETIDANVSFHAWIAGPLSANFCFESDANPALDPDYDNCAYLSGTGIEEGVMVTVADFGQQRVCSENIIAVTITNTGNFPIVVSSVTGNSAVPNNRGWANYTPGSDTLFSEDSSYFITGINDIIGETLYPHGDESYTTAQREFHLQVHFNPRTERLPYGNASLELRYTINFEPVEGIASITGGGIIRGDAVMPKLAASGYTFQPSIKYGTTHPTIGTITLEDTSWTTTTKIYSIKLLGDGQCEDFRISNLSRYQDNSPELVPIRNKITLDVTFTPADASPQQRTCCLEIASDAYACNTNGDTIRYDTICLIGSAYDDSWMVNNPDFGTFARCESPVMPISVSNAGTVPLQIDSISVPAAYSNLLVLENGITFPITVPANGPANEALRFRLDACNYVDDNGNPAEGALEIPVTVYSNMGAQTATFAADPLFIPVVIRLPKFETTPGAHPTLPIEIALANTGNQFYSFDNAQIRSFTIVLNVKHSQLHFENMFEGIGGWEFNIVSQTDDQVTITGTTTGEPLKGGIMVYPYVVVMVGTEGIIPISIESVSFDQACCIRLMSTEDGELNFDICAQVPRGDLVSSNTDYLLEPITPNPFYEKTLNINYSIGLDAKTTIQIFNSTGDLVKTAVDEYQKTGVHTSTVNISDLSSGIYQVTITSGPFEDTQSLVIVR